MRIEGIRTRCEEIIHEIVNGAVRDERVEVHPFSLRRQMTLEHVRHMTMEQREDETGIGGDFEEVLKKIVSVADL